MATTLDIRDDLLYPGDTIRFDYVIRGGNQTLLNMAISDIKKTIYADDRLDYQGSEIVTEVDKSGLEGSVREVQVLRIYAKVRRYRREVPPEIQEAGIGAIGVGVLIGVIATAVVAYSAVVVARGHSVTRAVQAVTEQVEKIRTDEGLSDEAKQAAFEALGKGIPEPKQNLGSGLTALGSGLVTTAMIIGVLWAVSLSSPRRGAAQ